MKLKRLLFTGALALAVSTLTACTATIPPNEPVSDGTNEVIINTDDDVTYSEGDFYIAGHKSGVVVQVPEAGWSLVDDEKTDSGIMFSAAGENDTINVASGKLGDDVKICTSREALDAELTEKLTEAIDFEITEFSYEETGAVRKEFYTYVVTDGSRGGTNIIRLTATGDEYVSASAYLANPSKERVEQFKMYLDNIEM